MRVTLVAIAFLTLACERRPPAIPPDPIVIAPIAREVGLNYNPVHDDESPSRLASVSRLDSFYAFFYHPTAAGHPIRMRLRRDTPNGSTPCGEIDARAATVGSASGGEMGDAETQTVEVCSGSQPSCFGACTDAEGYFLAGRYALEFETPGQRVSATGTDGIIVR